MQKDHTRLSSWQIDLRACNSNPISDNTIHGERFELGINCNSVKRCFYSDLPYHTEEKLVYELQAI